MPTRGFLDNSRVGSINRLSYRAENHLSPFSGRRGEVVMNQIKSQLQPKVSSVFGFYYLLSQQRSGSRVKFHFLLNIEKFGFDDKTDLVRLLFCR